MSLRERIEKNARYVLQRLTARLTQLGAIMLLSALGLAALALLSFDPADPSWNTTNLNSVENWLGPAGAYFADIMYQVVGHGVWLVMLPLVALAVRRLRLTSIERPNWRLLAGVAGRFGAGTGAGDLWFGRLGPCAVSRRCGWPDYG
jgi:S-DNA-T family DNA segregation ATPase FtsK/SpoIIIE